MSVQKKVEVQEQLMSMSIIPIGGDQLTIARILGSQKILSNSENGDERLERLIAVIEDWHTKMCFMEVNIYKGHQDKRQGFCMYILRGS